MTTRSSQDPGDHDPGQARARTSLAWTRTALSFAAVGGVILKRDIPPGLIVLVLAAVIWVTGRLTHHLRGRLVLVTVMIVAVSLVALALALLRGG